MPLEKLRLQAAVQEYHDIVHGGPWTKLTDEDVLTSTALIEEINELSPEKVAEENTKFHTRMLRLRSQGWDYDPQRLLNRMFVRRLGGGFQLR